MDIRKIIKEEVSKALLSEGFGFDPVPRTFDHLKWEFTSNQKHYLQRFCETNPKTISETEYKDASRFLGIPEKNVRSIINTYNAYDPMKENHGGRDSQASIDSQLTLGNKPATAADIGLSVEDSRLPDFEYPMGRQMHTNPNSMSNLERKSKYDADFKNRTWYREGEEAEHASKSRERFFEGLNTSLMMYLFCESTPKDINLRHDNKIQIDFEPIIKEGKFNQLGGLSYESEKYKKINELLETFNREFGCSFVIADHVELEDCQRLYIENNVTKQVDMSKDSMAMMKNHMIKEMMKGFVIDKKDSEITHLLGLDAGDTSWLYGEIGQTPTSDIFSKR